MFVTISTAHIIRNVDVKNLDLSLCKRVFLSNFVFTINLKLWICLKELEFLYA